MARLIIYLSNARRDALLPRSDAGQAETWTKEIEEDYGEQPKHIMSCGELNWALRTALKSWVMGMPG